MAYDFKELKVKIIDTEEWLKKEYLGVRTGRATPALLDRIQVEVYESFTPLNQVGSVSAEDARTLFIALWDTHQIKAVEKAIIDSNLGASAQPDEKGVRVIFPELTSERREQLLKVLKDKREHARVSLRGARDETWADIQKKEKDKEIGEDEKFRLKEEMEEMIQKANKELDEITKRKEIEISN